MFASGLNIHLSSNIPPSFPGSPTIYSPWRRKPDPPSAFFVKLHPVALTQLPSPKPIVPRCRPTQPPLLPLVKTKKKNPVSDNKENSQTLFNPLSLLLLPLHFNSLFEEFSNYFMSKIDAICASIPLSPDQGILPPQPPKH